MCPLYVSGLIGPGDRKSIQPMARQLALGDYDQLHHFIAAGVWDAAPVETELLVQADRLVGGSDAVLVIDDTAIPKKGTHSVGVAAQYASALGKTANCQTLVSLTLARGEVPVMLALRLFLPESLTSNQARLKRVDVPAEYRMARTKPEMALAEIDRAIAAGVRFGCVLADSGYGLSAPFRQGLTALPCSHDRGCEQSDVVDDRRRFSNLSPAWSASHSLRAAGLEPVQGFEHVSGGSRLSRSSTRTVADRCAPSEAANAEAVRTGGAYLNANGWRWRRRNTGWFQTGRTFGGSTAQVTQQRRGHEGIVDLRNITVFRSGHCAGPQIVLHNLWCRLLYVPTPVSQY